MTAQKFIEKHIKKSKQNSATVLALLEDGRGFWHVHRDEELPEPKYRPVIVFHSN